MGLKKDDFRSLSPTLSPIFVSDFLFVRFDDIITLYEQDLKLRKRENAFRSIPKLLLSPFRFLMREPVHRGIRITFEK